MRVIPLESQSWTKLFREEEMFNGLTDQAYAPAIPIRAESVLRLKSQTFRGSFSDMISLFGKRGGDSLSSKCTLFSSVRASPCLSLCSCLPAHILVPVQLFRDQTQAQPAQASKDGAPCVSVHILLKKPCWRLGTI